MFIAKSGRKRASFIPSRCLPTGEAPESIHFLSLSINELIDLISNPVFPFQVLNTLPFGRTEDTIVTLLTKFNEEIQNIQTPKFIKTILHNETLIQKN